MALKHGTRRNRSQLNPIAVKSGPLVTYLKQSMVFYGELLNPKTKTHEFLFLKKRKRGREITEMFSELMWLY